MATQPYWADGFDNFQLPENLHGDGSKNYTGGSIHDVGGLPNTDDHVSQESLDNSPDNESDDHNDFDDSLYEYQIDST
jgi:hypothetical protein